MEIGVLDMGKNRLPEVSFEEVMECGHMHDMYDEQIASFVEMVKLQHNTSLALTKLVLEYGKFSDLDEKGIHKIFTNSVEIVAKCLTKHCEAGGGTKS